MHATVYASPCLEDVMEAYGYDTEGALAFAVGLQEHLDKAGHSEMMTARINRDTPLRLIAGKADGRVLVLNLLDGEQWTDRRGHTEEYILNQLGVQPDCQDLEPHVTLGIISDAALGSREVRRDPSRLVPKPIIPYQVAFQGLGVYYSKISEQNRVLPNLSADTVMAEIDAVARQRALERVCSPVVQ
ncbi:MAG TPA: hypothetical protein VF261_02875 [Candidatus Saccharimonadales bacterium]